MSLTHGVRRSMILSFAVDLRLSCARGAAASACCTDAVLSGASGPAFEKGRGHWESHSASQNCMISSRFCKSGCLTGRCAYPLPGSATDHLRIRSAFNVHVWVYPCPYPCMCPCTCTCTCTCTSTCTEHMHIDRCTLTDSSYSVHLSMCMCMCRLGPDAPRGRKWCNFGRSGQAVSKECWEVVAGRRSPHGHRVIVRGVR